MFYKACTAFFFVTVIMDIKTKHTATALKPKQETFYLVYTVWVTIFNLYQHNRGLNLTFVRKHSATGEVAHKC